MLKQKVAWIIGASSGIGKALALKLAEDGWRVAISSRDLAKLESIACLNDNLFACSLDLTQLASIETAKDKLLQKYGVVDTVFLNAGDYTPMPLKDFDYQLFEKLNNINYLGVVNGLQAILPYMQTRQSGEIYVTASLAGYRGLPKAAPYNASKAAVISLVESLHLELKQQGIRIRLINPGFVDSPLTRKNKFEMPFIITPEEAANYIIKELPKSNFEIYFPKRFAWIMKFLRFIPYRLYFYLTKNSVKKGR